MATVKILISGFEPFDIDPENSSQLILREISQLKWPNVNTVLLPVSFDRAWVELKKAIDQFQPDIVLSLGQADTRPVITFEFAALNWIDARIKDEDGKAPVDQVIQDGGPLAVQTRLPIRALVEVLQASGTKSAVSYTAGTYVCNCLMYQLLHNTSSALKAGFIHVPLLRGQRLGQGRETLRPTAQLTLGQAVKSIETIVDLLSRGGVSC